jgi:hypothetical protein
MRRIHGYRFCGWSFEGRGNGQPSGLFSPLAPRQLSLLCLRELKSKKEKSVSRYPCIHFIFKSNKEREKNIVFIFQKYMIKKYKTQNETDTWIPILLLRSRPEGTGSPAACSPSLRPRQPPPPTPPSAPPPTPAPLAQTTTYPTNPPLMQCGGPVACPSA